MFENYDKQNSYLVACSGGPDSMALLNMLIQNNFNVIVAHINYKTREESDAEECLVRQYCANNNIRCFVDYFDHNYKGSFEVAARNFRYSFFAKIYQQEHCSGLFVAHHKDDLIETYLLKKQRNVINESYLIRKKTIINKMIVYRPLLTDFYKEDLLKYCQDNKISYGIDKTNFMDIHLRNIIRKDLMYQDKESIYQQALFEEQELINTRKEVIQFIKYYPVYLIELLKDKSDRWLQIFLYELCDKKHKKYINKSVLTVLKDFIGSSKANIVHLISDNYYLQKEYGKISFEYAFTDEFSYTLEKLEYISTPHFKLVKEGLKMQGIFLCEDDFPITIRSYKSDDKVELKSGNKKISRLFIDKKVPILQRKSVPIIENRHKQIIFVYKLYRKNGFKYVKNNIFMLK